MEDLERICFVCGNGPGELGPLGGQQEHELGLVHDLCWPKYREHPDLKAFEASLEEDREAKSLWVREGRTLGGNRAGRKQQAELIPFQVGDWLVRGEDRGFIGGSGTPDYREAEELTGYKKDSLYKFAYVARHVPSCIRMQKLPWAIHQKVAPVGQKFGQDLQKKLLQHAVNHRLSVARFNAYVTEELAKLADGAVLKAQHVPTEAAANPNLPGDNLAVRYMRTSNELLPPRKMLECSMTPTIRAKLVDELRQTAATLLSYAEKVREWGERPVEDQYKESVYKYENDKRAKAAKARASASK